MLLFHPRCGSSWLTTILQGNRNFHMEAEILDGEPTPALQRRRLAALYTRSCPAGVEAIGCKVAPHHIVDKGEFVRDARALGLRLLVLTRRNLVKAAISKMRGKRLQSDTATRYGTGDPNLVRDSDAIAPGPIDVDTLRHVLRRVETARNDVSFLVERLQLPRLELTYEALLADLGRGVAAVSEFLETRIGSTSTPLLKHTSDDLARIVTNLPALREALADTPYRGDLDEPPSGA